MSSIGFANESKPDENGKIHLFPCDLGSFVRQNMHKKIAECEKCPRGKYAYQYMRTFSLRKFTDLQTFLKHRVFFCFYSAFTINVCLVSLGKQLDLCYTLIIRLLQRPSIWLFYLLPVFINKKVWLSINLPINYS